MIQGRLEEIEIKGVEYIPKGQNLFSENVLLKKGFEVRKSDFGMRIIYYYDGVPDVQAEIRGDVQVMLFRPIVKKAMACAKKPQKFEAPVVKNNAEEKPVSTEASWHQRMGHINSKCLLKTAKAGAANGLEEAHIQSSKNCEVCIRTKAKKESYKSIEKTGDYKL